MHELSWAADSPSKFSCPICKGRHHTSLNFDRPVEPQSGLTSGAPFSDPSILLSTAMVGIYDYSLEDNNISSIAVLCVRNFLHHSKCCVEPQPQPCPSNSRCQDIWDWWMATISKRVSQLPVGPQKLPARALVLNEITCNIPSQPIPLYN